MEGVMMRGPVSWAVAVRKPDQDIKVEGYPLPNHQERHKWLKWPFFRGVYVLVESLSIGVKALKISARVALDEEMEDEAAADKAVGISMAFGFLFITAFFIAGPALISKVGGARFGVTTPLWQNLIEGAIRIGFFVGYIFLISLIPDIRRVFQYHGAEHKTIYAYENDEPLEPAVIDKYTTLHVRCGTNFLFIVMFLTIAGHFVADLFLEGFPIWVKIVARILMIPLLAGSSYEVIRAAGRKEESAIFKFVSLPGLALQKITTRPPSYDQIEVAIKAMEAVIARQKLAEAEAVETGMVETREVLPSPKPGDILKPQPGPAGAGSG